jgi:D-3-phosphoglycerate dehydrogenase / 2-oxoglutarate reductase
MMGVGASPMKTSLDKDKIKILLLEGIHRSAVDAFREDGYSNIEYHPKALPEADLACAAHDAFFVGIRSGTRLTPGFFEQAARLVGVGCFCIGVNQVDLDAARERCVPVFNAPFSNTRSVAELVLAEAILLLRGIPHRSAMAKRGVWLKTAAESHEARGRLVGIVGYGHIGSQLSVLAEALGMRVIYYDIEARLALGNARPVATLEALLEVSDVVSLHVPETAQTSGMIGVAQLARMKKGAHLINASRGTVVDIEALAAALRSQHLGGAAVDVFPREPGSGAEEFASPLREFENVILTPHIGGSTEEAQESIGVEVAGKLIKYSNNGSTLSAVNFPEVSLPEHPGKQRLLHIHRNQPGVLSGINAVFSERRINISGQYLQTGMRIGYVVIDIELEDPAGIFEIRRGLEAVPGTIRTRILF